MKVAIVVAIMALAVSGCAAFKPQADTGEAPERTTSRQIGAANARIDVPEIIESADGAGCDLKTILYEEGKRQSKLGLYCDNGIDLPVQLTPASFK